MASIAASFAYCFTEDDWMLFGYISAVVTGLLILHVLCLMVAPYSKHYRRFKQAALVLGVVSILCLPATSWANYSFRLRPDTLFYMIVLGNLAFLISLSSARYSLKIGWRNFAYFYRRIASSPINAYVPLLLVMAIYEEVIWRGAIQVRLGNSVWAILLTVPLFYLSHVPPTRKFRIPRVIDLCALTLLQGVCYYVFENLTMVIGIHFVKNYCSYSIRYQKDAKYSAHIDGVLQKVLARVRLPFGTSLDRSDSVRIRE
jgi:membrane protease YdiL (CAAX protease family)